MLSSAWCSSACRRPSWNSSSSSAPLRVIPHGHSRMRVAMTSPSLVDESVRALLGRPCEGGEGGRKLGVGQLAGPHPTEQDAPPERLWVQVPAHRHATAL